MQSQPDAPLPKTLISSLEPFNKHDSFPKHVFHPFATAAPETTGLLQDLINTTEQLSDSLRVYNTAQWTNAKLPSVLRQYTAKEQSSHSVRFFIVLHLFSSHIPHSRPEISNTFLILSGHAQELAMARMYHCLRRLSRTGASNNLWPGGPL